MEIRKDLAEQGYRIPDVVSGRQYSQDDLTNAIFLGYTEESHNCVMLESGVIAILYNIDLE